MGKKSYDSYSEQSRGRGGPGMKTSPKGSMPMATDTKVGAPDSYKGAGASVTESRLNKGGDKAFKGTRGSRKTKAGAYSHYG